MEECVINTSGKVITSYQIEKMPTIMIWIDPILENNQFIRNILYGIEEEEVPVHCIIKKGNGLDLSFMASAKSRLGVGIGMGSDQKIVLHYHRLPKYEPLFTFDLNNISKVDLRNLGTNAARLIKRIPLKIQKIN